MQKITHLDLPNEKEHQKGVHTIMPNLTPDHRNLPKNNSFLKRNFIPSKGALEIRDYFVLTTYVVIKQSEGIIQQSRDPHKKAR